MRRGSVFPALKLTVSAFAALAVLAVRPPTPSGAEETLRVALAPSVTTQMIAYYLRDSGIWKKWGGRGVGFRVTFAHNTDLALAQKEAGVVLLSAIDVARLTVDDGLEILMFGKDSTSYEGIYARAAQPGKSPLDFRGTRLVHPGWDARGTRIGRVIFAALWDLDMEAGFQVVTAPWRVGPEMLVENEADLALNAMPFILSAWRDRKLRPVGKSFAAHWAEKRGRGRPLGGLFWTAWRGWLDQAEEKARALLAAWGEGMAYANQETEAWAERYLPEALRGASKGDARFFAQWFRRERPVYETPYLSPQDVKDETSFLRIVVEVKLVRALPRGPLWRIILPQKGVQFP